MAMDIRNILLGTYIERNGVDLTGQVAGTMKAEIEQSGVQVGLFDTFSTKGDVTKAVSSNKYDVVICQEELNGEKLGGGCVNEWKNINPKIQIIFIIDAQKKGGIKLQNLFNKNYYYDAIYGTELTGANLARLIKMPRTRQEAFVYYGLDQLSKQKENAVETEESVVENMEEAPVETEAENVVVEGEVLETGLDEKDGSAEDDFEAKLQDMEKYFSEGSDETESEQEEEESFFSGMSFFENTVNNRMPEDEETGKEVMDSFSNEGSIFNKEEQPEVSFEVTSEEVVSSYNNVSNVVKENVVEGGGLVVTGRRPVVAQRKLHIKGVVAEVMSEELLMVVFHSPLELVNGEMISDYALTLLIQTGEKGHMENGKYKTGILTLTGYGNCLIDEQTAILEVPGVNLFSVADKIEAKDLNMVLTRQ